MICFIFGTWLWYKQDNALQSVRSGLLITDSISSDWTLMRLQDLSVHDKSASGWNEVKFDVSPHDVSLCPLSRLQGCLLGKRQPPSIRQRRRITSPSGGTVTPKPTCLSPTWLVFCCQSLWSFCMRWLTASRSQSLSINSLQDESSATKTGAKSNYNNLTDNLQLCKLPLNWTNMAACLETSSYILQLRETCIWSRCRICPLSTHKV